MPWLLRRRLRAPAVVAVADLGAVSGSRVTLMRTCRIALAERGFALQLRRGALVNPVGDAAVEVAVARAEMRADRDDYWWDGTLCWVHSDGTTIVAPERDGPMLRLLGWGPSADEVLDALVELAHR
jgi:hypothetical protein